VDQLQSRELPQLPQLKVSFSLGTKLVLSVLALLLIVIGFLNLSTIFLFKEDKRAYVYQAQSTSAVLAGREFVNMAKHGVDTLRLALASIDPNSPDRQKIADSLASVARNQSEAAAISVYLVDIKSLKITPLGSAGHPKKSSQVTTQDSELNNTQLKTLLPALLKDSFAFFNPSSLGGTPVLGAAVADLNLKDNPAGMPVAIAAIPLTDFGRELGGLNLTIATRSAWVLFDSDPAVQFASKNILEDPLFRAATGSKVANGALEYDVDENRYLGSYVNPGLDLVVTSRTEWKKAMRATYALIETVIYLGLMAIGAAAIGAILFARSLTAPLIRLYEGTKEVSRGNFNLELGTHSHSKDEIGALTSSFNVMSRKISELIQEQLKKAHLENELAIASTVQQTLIPPEKFKDDRILIHSLYRSASECGGDWWGYFRVGNRLCLMIADATGHGMPSALITASARSCASMLHKLAQEDPEFTFSPAAMLSYANRVVYDASMAKIMMTFFCGVIDFEAKTFTYSNAGHNPPWLFKKNSTSGKYELKSIVAVGSRLGELQENHSFEEKQVSVEEGDILFMYTDGLMEGKSSQGDMYGKKRVRKLIESVISQGPGEIIPNLMSDFMKHNGEKPLDDDVTLAVATLLNPAASPT
jgi:serine phosphatase RsbU (regulator of sigma subunit)